MWSQSDEESHSEVVSKHSFEVKNDQTDSESTVEKSDTCSFSDIRRKLRDWSVNHNISHSALSELLHLLVQCGLELPKDPLFCQPQQPTKSKILELDATAILECLTQSFQPCHRKHIPQYYNTAHDGIPLSGSSKQELWPILAKIKELPRANVGVIGLFAGPTKPQCIHEYLKNFIEELSY